MEILFFNSCDVLSDISSKIFECLNISDTYEGDSTHYINETYYAGNVFGLISVKIAENNYGYENTFKYFIIVSKAVCAEFAEEDNVYSVCCNMIASAIASKLNIPAAMEIEGVDSSIFLYFSMQNDELLIEQRLLSTF